MPVLFSATVAVAPEVISGVSFWPVKSIDTAFSAVAPTLSVAVTTDPRAAVQVQPHALSTYDDLHDVNGGNDDDAR